VVRICNVFWFMCVWRAEFLKVNDLFIRAGIGGITKMGRELEYTNFLASINLIACDIFQNIILVRFLSSLCLTFCCAM
jgi:hypothetical protein